MSFHTHPVDVDSLFLFEFFSASKLNETGNNSRLKMAAVSPTPRAIIQDILIAPGCSVNEVLAYALTVLFIILVLTSILS